MSDLSDLHAEGVTDLQSYFVGKQDEQARIIELLEGLEPWGAVDTAFVPDLIALIKGEK